MPQPGGRSRGDRERHAASDALRAFAPWSIHVELDSAEGTLAVLHDCGRSIGVELSQAEAGQLSRSLAGAVRVEALHTRAQDRPSDQPPATTRRRFVRSEDGPDNHLVDGRH